jgi:hypothetical protein
MSKDYLKWYSEPVTKEVQSDYYTAPVKSLRKTKVGVKKVNGVKIIDINEKNKSRRANDSSSDSGMKILTCTRFSIHIPEEDKAVVIQEQKREARMRTQLSSFKDVGMF